MDDYYNLDIEEQVHSTLLTINNPNRYSMNRFILSTLNDGINNGTITTYKDKNCTIPYLKQELDSALIYEQIDTIITFDPETFAEEMKFVTGKYSRFYENPFYRLNQIWSIDTTTHQLKTTIKSYAFTIDTAKGAKPLFHLKNKPQNIHYFPSDIVWLKSIVSVRTFDNPTFVKYLLDDNFLKYQNLRKDDYKSELIDYQDNEAFFTQRIDTIITFNPKTFKEQFTYNHFIYKDIVTQFKIIQHIYYNQKTKNLETNIVAIAPLYDFYPLNNKPLKPLFWIVFDENFIKEIDAIKF